MKNKLSDYIVVSLVIIFFICLTLAFSFGIAAMWFGDWDGLKRIVFEEGWLRKIPAMTCIVFMMIWYAFIARFFYILIWNNNPND